MKRMIFVVPPLFLAVVLSVGFLLYSPVSDAKPAVSWEPGSLDESIAAGESVTTSATFTASIDAGDVKIRVVPELAPYVTVSPTSISTVQKGIPYRLTIAINIPQDMELGVYNGVIQLRQAAPGKPEKVLARPLPIEMEVTEFVDNGLPPDPGDAGTQTLLGIDSDADGVRDDIQRYIYFAYPNDEKVQAALTEVAKQYQILLPTASDPDAAFNNATKMARHGECLDYIKGEDAADILSALRAEVLNTRERSIAYITYSDTLGGEIILGKPLADWKTSCAFDVDAIGVAQ